MAWTTPTTRSTSDLITASIWNTDLTDNLAYLKTSADRVAFSIEVFAAAATLTTGDGKRYISIPVTLEGMNVVSISAGVFAKSTSGTPTIMVARGRQANATSAHTFNDMLSTALTIDVDEYDTQDATTAAVISATYDDLAEGDLLRIDVDVAGTGATGLWVRFEARLP